MDFLITWPEKRDPIGPSPGFASQIYPQITSLYTAIGVGTAERFIEAKLHPNRLLRKLDLQHHALSVTSLFGAQIQCFLKGTQDFFSTLVNTTLDQFRKTLSENETLLSMISNCIRTALIGQVDFPQKLITHQPLSELECCTVLEVSAHLFGVAIHFYSQAGTRTFGSERLTSPLHLSGNFEEGFSLWYEPETVILFNKIDGLDPDDYQSIEGGCSHSSGDIVSIESDTVFEQGTLQCILCKVNIQDNLAPQCEDHHVCSSCRLHSFLFGSRTCQACSRQYSDKESKELSSLKPMSMKDSTYIVGSFHCQHCNEDRIWANIECSKCYVCKVCSGSCSCDEFNEIISIVTCSLCYGPGCQAVRTPCDHIFCRSCAHYHFYYSKQCPSCQQYCDPEKIYSIVDFANFTSGKMKNQIIQAMANLLCNPELSYKQLYPPLSKYLELVPMLKDYQEVNELQKVVYLAQLLSGKPCTHASSAIVCANQNSSCQRCQNEKSRYAESHKVSSNQL